MAHTAIKTGEVETVEFKGTVDPLGVSTVPRARFGIECNPVGATAA